MKRKQVGADARCDRELGGVALAARRSPREVLTTTSQHLRNRAVGVSELIRRVRADERVCHLLRNLAD